MKAKFNIGDKVKVVKNGYGIGSIDINKKVTIILNTDEYMINMVGYYVDPPLGNNLRGSCIGEDSFELVETSHVNKSTDFKIGKKVKLISSDRCSISDKLVVGQIYTIKLTEENNIKVEEGRLPLWINKKQFTLVKECKPEEAVLDKPEIGQYYYILDKSTSALTVGKIYKMNQIDIPLYHFDIDGSNLKNNSCWLTKECFRKATEEEVKIHESKKTEQKVKYYDYEVVHCTTQEEWNFVNSKLKTDFKLDNSAWYVYKEKSCKMYTTRQYSTIDYYKNHNSLILSFQEWCDKFYHTNPFKVKSDELKPEDLVEGQWYELNTSIRWIVKFKSMHGRAITTSKCSTPHDNYTDKFGGGISTYSNLKHANMEEVYRLFPEERPEEVSKTPSSIDLLEEAKRRYPIGTKFHPAHLDNTSEYCIVTNINFYKRGNVIVAKTNEGDDYNLGSIYGNTSYNRIVYSNGKWAKIINTPSKPSKDELLRITKEKYPIGTIYIPLGTPIFGEEYEAIYDPLFVNDIGIEVGIGYVYLFETNEWAEIISKYDTDNPILTSPILTSFSLPSSYNLQEVNLLKPKEDKRISTSVNKIDSVKTNLKQKRKTIKF